MHSTFLECKDKWDGPANRECTTNGIKAAKSLSFGFSVAEAWHGEEEYDEGSANDWPADLVSIQGPLGIAFCTYFMKNIHRQVERSLMTPPRTGPSVFAMAKQELMTPE